MKTCTRCNVTKTLDKFHKQKCGFHGRTSMCKKCKSKYRKEYRKNNKNVLLEKESEYRKNNKKRVSESNANYYKKHRNKILKQCAQYYVEHKECKKKYLKQYRLNNKERKRDAHQMRLKTDINYRLSCNLRSRLGNIVKQKIKAGSSIDDLGCSIKEFKLYIEQKFYAHMSWDNYGKTWQLDHILPLLKFDLSIREQFLKACHYKNIQPLLNADHYIKTAHDIRNSQH